jgi:rare lipoprotein A (peptidoglycan hydrolase)
MRAQAFGRWQWAALLCVLISFAAGGVLVYRHHAAHVANEKADDDDETEMSSSDSASQHQDKSSRARKNGREVLASWYDVPLGSLAARRAGLAELTAAHDHLPIGTLVRVTRPDTGKSVTVRITDRGIHNRRVKLDICKEAAEQLDMVSKGIARVRMEVISDEQSASPAEVRATSAP